ncbi:MAG: DDE-type integrase/transposase/recombinase, partial [Betaproteobacteria bacterium]
MLAHLSSRAEAEPSTPLSHPLPLPLSCQWGKPPLRQEEEPAPLRSSEAAESLSRRTPSLNRWVIKYTPLLEMAFRQRKRPVGTSWRMDETYISVKGQWQYLYRAVDKAGHTVDFLLTANRDRKAASRFLRKSIDQCGTPHKT